VRPGRQGRDRNPTAPFAGICWRSINSRPRPRPIAGNFSFWRPGARERAASRAGACYAFLAANISKYNKIPKGTTIIGS